MTVPTVDEATDQELLDELILRGVLMVEERGGLTGWRHALAYLSSRWNDLGPFRERYVTVWKTPGNADR